MSSQTNTQESANLSPERVVVHVPKTVEDSERARVRRKLVGELEALLLHGARGSRLVIGAQLVAEHLIEIGEEEVARALRDLIA